MDQRTPPISPCPIYHATLHKRTLTSDRQQWTDRVYLLLHSLRQYRHKRSSHACVTWSPSSDWCRVSLRKILQAHLTMLYCLRGCLRRAGAPCKICPIIPPSVVGRRLHQRTAGLKTPRSTTPNLIPKIRDTQWRYDAENRNLLCSSWDIYPYFYRTPYLDYTSIYLYLKLVDRLRFYFPHLWPRGV